MPHHPCVLYVAHRVFVRTNCSDYGSSRAAPHYPALVMGGRGAVTAKWEEFTD